MTRHMRWIGFAVASLAVVGVTRLRASDGDGDSAGAEKMRAAMQLAVCLTCHPAEKDRAKLADLARCCDQHCTACHEDMEKHHPVGAEVSEKDKIGLALPLLGKDKLGCISCHDVNAPRTDTKSWKSQSLYARLFQGQDVYKTYLLRINNSTGKLCKACH